MTMRIDISFPSSSVFSFRLPRARFVAAFAVVFVCLHGTAQMTESNRQGGETVHIKVSLPAEPQVIPETLFGSFLEPIGHSTYGGLWADVVENPSFENGLWSAANEENMVRARPELRRGSQLGLPLPWEPLDSAQGARYLPVRGDAANSNQSILVMSLPGKEVGILEQVYLPVHRELKYNGSVWLKHVRGPADVSVSIRRHAHPEQVLASDAIQATAEEWTKYEFTLELKEGQLGRLEPADLVISLSNDARVKVDNISLTPADAVDGMDPDEVAMAKALRSPVVRFGGNFTSAYHWPDGVGPMDKRVSVLNTSWGIPEYNTFGTDELLRFCKLIGAEPQIALNLGTGTPEEAGAWVRYVDEHWNKGKGGLLWEMGNELWGDFQIGYPSQERVAAVTLATSKAVRAVDPDSRLIATGGDEDFFPAWNAQQLKNPKNTFNFLSTHFVVTDRVQLPHPPNDFRTMAALALPWGLAEKMHAIQKQAAENSHPDARVAFTEWLMVSDTHTAPNFTNLGGALFAGGFLNMVMRNSDVVSISDMTGIMEFGGIWKKRSQVYGAPAYWVLREYAQQKPHWLMHVSSDSPTYSISHGISRLPEIKDVPYLDCSAGEDEAKRNLILTCVNRNLTRSVDAEIDLGRVPVDRGVSAQASTITGENILVENDEEGPGRVLPVTRGVTIPRSGAMHYSFPNASVSVIRISLQK